MNAALYIRVSTDDQLEFSPSAQKRALVEYAEKNGYEVNEKYIFIDEGISGTSAKKRPAFQNMIAIAKTKPKPFDAILVHKFDRFARSREDSVVYKSLLRKECGIKVISITEQLEDDKFSVILEAMLEAMAEYYSLNLSDEVMKGMLEKARRGEVQSKSIIGYDIINNKKVINNDEAEIVRTTFKMYLNGESANKIARYLNSLGYRNKKGNLIDARQINYMLKNISYVGDTRWNYTHQQCGKIVVNDSSKWIIAENTHEAIIDRETFDEVQKLLDSKYKPHKQGASDYKHWLGGLLRCGTCGGTLTFKQTNFKKKDGKVWKADGYQCCKYRRGTCKTSNYISVELLRKHLINMLSESIDIIHGTGTVDALNIERVNVNTDCVILEAQLDKLNNKLTLAKKAYLNEIDTLEEYRTNKQQITSEIKSIKDKLDKIKVAPIAPEEFINKLSSALDMIKDESVGIMDKNKYLKSFISSITVDKSNNTMTIHYFS